VTSQLNVDGEINIESTKQDTMDNLVILSSNLLDVSHLLKNSCLSLNLEEAIKMDRFVVIPYLGSPPAPDDLQPSQLRTNTPMPPISSASDGRVPINPASKLAFTTCQQRR
jgi:hypothetical protein